MGIIVSGFCNTNSNEQCVDLDDAVMLFAGAFTFLRERTADAVYLVVNGGKYWVHNPQELAQLPLSTARRRPTSRWCRPARSRSSRPVESVSTRLHRRRRDPGLPEVELGHAG